MGTVEIVHSASGGTVVYGLSRSGTAAHQVLKDAGFRFSRGIAGGAWFIRGSRDRDPQTWRIEQAAVGLRALGFEVIVDVDASERPVGEREADRVDRTESRVAALTAKADRQAVEAETMLSTARDMADVIPLGQPMMPGHHSYKRDRNYRDRIGAKFDRGFAGLKEADETGRRAEAAERNQRERLSVPVTLRRIRTLEAELGRLTRQLDGHQVGRVDEVTEEIAYWRAHVAALEASGVKVWGAADFVPGDRVRTPHVGTVIRVNKKSLTVEWDLMPNVKQTVHYDKVTGKIAR